MTSFPSKGRSKHEMLMLYTPSISTHLTFRLQLCIEASMSAFLLESVNWSAAQKCERTLVDSVLDIPTRGRDATGEGSSGGRFSQKIAWGGCAINNPPWKHIFLPTSSLSILDSAATGNWCQREGALFFFPYAWLNTLLGDLIFISRPTWQPTALNLGQAWQKIDRYRPPYIPVFRASRLLFGEHGVQKQNVVLHWRKGGNVNKYVLHSGRTGVRDTWNTPPRYVRPPWVLTSGQTDGQGAHLSRRELGSESQPFFGETPLDLWKKGLGK